jgi:hypothetical protein
MFARIRVIRASNRGQVNSFTEGSSVGAPETEEGRMTFWIYVDTTRQVGDRDHLKVFADEDAAEKWFADNEPEGVAFEYTVQGDCT